ncbi:hypothetical protein T439DRAFT_357792 [Meredithblackwellia eburnea MCA 4105]
MLLEWRDDDLVKKSKVLQLVNTRRRWETLSFKQVAMIDVQLLQDKPTARSWTAYHFKPASQSSTSTNKITPTQLASRLRGQLELYFPLCLHSAVLPSVSLSSTPPPTSPSDDPTTSLQILHLTLPSSTTPSSPLLLPLLHPLGTGSSTAYFLLPSSFASATFVLPILLQALSFSLGREGEVVERQLGGRDWRGLLRLILEAPSGGGGAMRAGASGPAGGGWKAQDKESRLNVLGVVNGEKERLRKKRKLKEEDGMDKGGVKRDKQLAVREKERVEEAELVLGRGELPVVERLDYEIHLPHPSVLSQDNNGPEHEPFLLRLEGTSVLSGLRALIDQGFVDDGLPGWLGRRTIGEGRNALRIG